MNKPTRILGIDPGSRLTGYGIIDSDGLATRYVASGCLKLGDGPFAGRLRDIYARIGALVEEYAPHHVAIEQVFVHRNADSALKLGHARAAAICATFAGEPELFEYAAREIKKAVVGGGAAGKEQVQHMVRVILDIEAMPQTDEADALAVAICHAHSFRLRTAGKLMRVATTRRAAGRSGWRKFAG